VTLALHESVTLPCTKPLRTRREVLIERTFPGLTINEVYETPPNVRLRPIFVGTILLWSSYFNATGGSAQRTLRLADQ
jgi:hypothetical protein